MESTDATRSGTSRKSRFIPIWVLVLAGILLAVAYPLQEYRQEQADYVNRHFFQTLNEAVTELDAKLDQLKSIHISTQSCANKLALFPSYKSEDSGQDGCKIGNEMDVAKNKKSPEKTPNTSPLFKLKLTTDKVEVFLNKNPEKLASVDIADVFPSPKSGFSSYLIVDSKSRVISKIGGELALSIVDTKEISKRISAQKKQNWVNFFSASKTSSEAETPELPGYSIHIDTELASGPVRLFLYPFLSDLNNDPNNESAKHLYLIGVLPEAMLNIRDNQRWNLAILMIVVVILLFGWCLLRLFLMSPNETLGKVFYYGTVLCSFALFVLLASGLIAFHEQQLENEDKKYRASKLIDNMAKDFEQDLIQIFDQLEDYRQFYRNLSPFLIKPEKVEVVKNIGDISLDSEELQYSAGFLQKQLLDGGLSTGLAIAGLKLCDGTHYSFDPGYISDLKKFEQSWSRDFKSKLSDTRCTPEESIHLVRFTGLGIKPIKNRPFHERFDPSAIKNIAKPAKPDQILSVFLMNEQGRQRLPQFNFTEINRASKAFDLSHRSYFQKVRDRQGWSITLDRSCLDDSGCNDSGTLRRENFYIQRLFDIATGTRGTTLGMPLLDSQGLRGTESESDAKGLFLGADIDLPSLSLSEWPGPGNIQDFIFMVIDQHSGKVLFHMDKDRALIENFYRSGEASSRVIRKLKSGSEIRTKDGLKGYYHGDSGSYLSKNLAINQWSLVVFIPDNNTASYMTNLFLANSVSMTVVLILIGLTLYLLRHWFDTGSIKKSLRIPLAINHRRIMIFSAVFVASIYFGYWTGSAMERQIAVEFADQPLSGQNISMIAPAITMLIALLWGYYQYRQLYFDSRQAQKEPLIRYRVGALGLTIMFLFLGLALTDYLHHVGKEPIGALHSWYFPKNYYPAALNRENKELKNIALSRYPNSITRFEENPLRLLPISQGWRDCLGAATIATDSGKPTETHDCWINSLPRDMKKGAMPEDVGHFSQLTHSTGTHSWIERYLFAGGRGSSSDKQEGRFPRVMAPQYPFLISFYFVLLCTLWFLFNSRILYVRLFGSPSFLRHINQISSREPTSRQYTPNSQFVIELDGSPPNGQNLELLLMRFKRCQEENDSSSSQHNKSLFSLCPLLKQAADSDNPCPYMKIMINDTESPNSVELWEMENSLAHQESRQFLLRLINQFKSLHATGQLKSFTLHMGFHTLERILIKGETLRSVDMAEHQMSRVEYATWSECLMDFSVKLPADIETNIDLNFIHKECKALPLLRGLCDQSEESYSRIEGSGNFNELRWTNLTDRQKNYAEWASINWILIKAGALFRFKWESCAPAEKLALYQLAHHGRINPANPQMMEQLALEGLIKVRKGRIRIANNSFAYFVRHAEDPDSLKQLVYIGKQGKWTSYGLPISIVIAFAIISVGMTSGSSLLLIFSSLTGVLGTFATLATSSRVIRDNMPG
jgi:hypothetical protein